jgi:hypothetical protein
MNCHPRILASVGCLSATLLLTSLDATSAQAQCQFAASTSGYGADGDSAALIANGSVTVSTPAVYKTSYSVDVMVWVDDKLAALASDIPALVLSYFEHANCIYANGVNTSTNKGVHDLSLRIYNNRIYYYQDTTPLRTYVSDPATGATAQALWAQEYHQHWNTAIAAMGAGAPKLHVVFSASNFMEILSVKPDGTIIGQGNGGASNGIGQGHAMVRVASGKIRNGGSATNNEDWWGDIAAHELGHAMGFGGHLAQLYDTMCCVGPERDHAFHQLLDVDLGMGRHQGQQCLHHRHV